MAIKLLLVILFLVVFVEAGFIVWLLRNFTEFRDITTHNANVFSTAIAQHSTKIADVTRDLKEAQDDLYGEQSEISKKIKQIETSNHDISIKVDGMYMAVTAISKTR